MKIKFNKLVLNQPVSVSVDGQDIVGSYNESDNTLNIGDYDVSKILIAGRYKSFIASDISLPNSLASMGTAGFRIPQPKQKHLAITVNHHCATQYVSGTFTYYGNLSLLKEKCHDLTFNIGWEDLSVLSYLSGLDSSSERGFYDDNSEDPFENGTIPNSGEDWLVFQYIDDRNDAYINGSSSFRPMNDFATTGKMNGVWYALKSVGERTDAFNNSLSAGVELISDMPTVLNYILNAKPFAELEPNTDFSPEDGDLTLLRRLSLPSSDWVDEGHNFVQEARCTYDGEIDKSKVYVHAVINGITVSKYVSTIEVDGSETHAINEILKGTVDSNGEFTPDTDGNGLQLFVGVMDDVSEISAVVASCSNVSSGNVDSVTGYVDIYVKYI